VSHRPTPFKAASVLETLEQCSQEPVPPRSLQPSVPRDLQTICLKRLEKEPSRRYSSAAELAADLGRSRGEPIHAGQRRCSCGWPWAGAANAGGVTGVAPCC
jgi:hypothetical protein